MEYEFTGVNEALVVLCRELLKNHVVRTLGGFQKNTSARCLEFPEPVTVKIQDPTARAVLIPARKWNPILPAAESLWMILGSNDLDSLPGRYVKNLYTYSDDGHTWRAGYGSRLRRYNGSTEQYYEKADSDPREERYVDQFRFVIDLLKKDPSTREAMLSIHDPMKDDQVGLVTRDQPCTRTIQFMSVEDKMNGYVTMRSNDLIYGASAVNWTNFTFMLEYMSRLLRVPMGGYYHFASNLHVYESKLSLVEELARVDIEKAREYDHMLSYRVDVEDEKFPCSLIEFDRLCRLVYLAEKHIYEHKKESDVIDYLNRNYEFPHQLFYEWVGMFYWKNVGKSFDYLNSHGINRNSVTLSRVLFLMNDN